MYSLLRTCCVCRHLCPGTVCTTHGCPHTRLHSSPQCMCLYGWACRWGLQPLWWGLQERSWALVPHCKPVQEHVSAQCAPRSLCTGVVVWIRVLVRVRWQVGLCGGSGQGGHQGWSGAQLCVAARPALLLASCRPSAARVYSGEHSGTMKGSRGICSKYRHTHTAR